MILAANHLVMRIITATMVCLTLAASYGDLCDTDGKQTVLITTPMETIPPTIIMDRAVLHTLPRMEMFIRSRMGIEFSS